MVPDTGRIVKISAGKSKLCGWYNRETGAFFHIAMSTSSKKSNTGTEKLTAS